MNYDLSKKSIYVLFHNYEVRIIEKVIKRFKNEPTSYSLLQQQFGPDLKGRTSMVFPNYMQMARLQTILARFEKILKFVIALEETGKTETEIDKILASKDEVVFYKYVESLLGKPKEYITNNFNINKYIKDKKISLKFLADAVDCHENELEKKAFKYRYGLNISKMEDTMIMSLLGISKSKLDECIRNVANQLDSLLVKYEKMMEEYDLPVQKVKVRVRAKVATKAKGDSQKKSATPVLSTQKSTEKIGNKTLNKRFVNYIITPYTLKEEITEIEDKIEEASKTEYIKSLKGYEIASKYFGKNLLSEYRGSYDSQSDTIMIKGLASTIEKYIKTGSFRKVSSEKKEKESKYSIYFIGNFTGDDLSSKEREIANKNIYVIIKDLKEKYPKGYQLLIDMYDADFKSENTKKKELTKGEASSFRAIIKRAKEIIKFMAIENTDDYETYKENHRKRKTKVEESKFKKYFIEYLISPETTEEEKKSIQEKIKMIIECCDALYKKNIEKIIPIYGEYLDGEFNPNNVSMGTTRSLNSAIRKIKETLNNYSEFISMNKKFKNIENFLNTSGLTEEEKQEFVDKVIEVLNSTYYKNHKPVIYLKEYFGEDLKQNYTGSYDRGKSAAIRTFFRNNIDKIKDGGVKKEVFKNKFSEYLTQGKSDEITEILNKYYYVIIVYIKRNTPEFYNILHEIYGPQLRNELSEEIIIKRDAKILLNNFINKTLPKIIENKLYLVNPYNHIAISLYDALIYNIPKEEAIERIKKYLQIKMDSNYHAYQTIIDFFGTDLMSNKNYFEVTVAKKVQIKKYIKEIQEIIDLSKEEYETLINQNEKSLIDAIRLEGYSDEEIIKTIKYCLPSEGAIHNLIIDNFGENFDLKVNFSKFKKKDYFNINYFIKKCQKYLTGELENIRVSKTGYDIFIDTSLSEEEQTIQKERVALIIENKNPSQALSLLLKILKEDLPITSIEDKKEQLNLRTFIKTIKDELKDFSYSKYLEPDQLVVLNIPTDASVIASLVFKFTRIYKKPEIVAEKLKISIDEVIKVYFEYSSCLDLEQLMNYIVFVHPEYINKLFEIDELKEYKLILTDIEKEIIYLNLLSKTDETISTKEIANITGVDTTDIKRYYVMTQSDSVNKLNLILHKRKRNK